MLSRHLAADARITLTDVADAAEVKANSTVSEGDGAVAFAQKALALKPRPSSQRIAVETSALFAATNDPLAHTTADVARFFQLDATMPRAVELFYHNGFCGEHVAARSQQLKTSAMMAANEAYRVTDANIFTQLPPDLEGSALHENPEASAHFLLSFYLSQREKLATIPIKDAERRAHYAAAATDAAVGPTLADMLAPVARDAHEGFADFPMPVRPIYDLLRELQLVTEYPTLLVIDGWNRWTQMASSCHWRTKRPLHASDLLVPALCGGDLRFGESMARGVMLCATTHRGAMPAGVPLSMRKHVPVPPEFRKLHELRRDARFRERLLEVRPYRLDETQAALDFYALVGHMTNGALDGQLRTGELASKIRLTTSGNADDLFKLAEQM